MQEVDKARVSAKVSSDTSRALLEAWTRPYGLLSCLPSPVAATAMTPAPRASKTPRYPTPARLRQPPIWPSTQIPAPIRNCNAAKLARSCVRGSVAAPRIAPMSASRARATTRSTAWVPPWARQTDGATLEVVGRQGQRRSSCAAERRPRATGLSRSGRGTRRSCAIGNDGAVRVSP